MQFLFNFCHLFPHNVALYKPQPNRSPNIEVVNGNHCKSNGFHTDTRLKGKRNVYAQFCLDLGHNPAVSENCGNFSIIFWDFGKKIHYTFGIYNIYSMLVPRTQTFINVWNQTFINILNLFSLNHFWNQGKYTQN